MGRPENTLKKAPFLAEDQYITSANRRVKRKGCFPCSGRVGGGEDGGQATRRPRPRADAVGRRRPFSAAPPRPGRVGELKEFGCQSLVGSSHWFQNRLWRRRNASTTRRQRPQPRPLSRNGRGEIVNHTTGRSSHKHGNRPLRGRPCRRRSMPWGGTRPAPARYACTRVF